tara:strand:+ start:84 stop:191 length:108 start_codon:yes stop_codon:yes gene_type:complete
MFLKDSVSKTSNALTTIININEINKVKGIDIKARK